MSAGSHSGQVGASAGGLGSSIGSQQSGSAPHQGSGGAPRQGAGGGSTPPGGAEPADLGAVASDLAGAAAEQGRVLLQSAKGQAVSFADQRKDTAAESIANIASSLRDTGKGFEEQPTLQTFVSSAADGLDQLATGLRDRSFADIYGDVEAYARRQPVTVAAAAAVAGFLLARFIKSSAEELSDVNARRGYAGPRAGSSAHRV